MRYNRRDTINKECPYCHHNKLNIPRGVGNYGYRCCKCKRYIQ